MHKTNPFVALALVTVCCHSALATEYIVAGQNPLASDKNPGTPKQPFKTISRAAELAQPGDTVTVQPGLYRERVTPARGGTEGKPIIYRAAVPHAVTVRGSEVFRPEWKPTADAGLFYGALNSNWFGERNPYLIALKISGGGPTVAARPSKEARQPLTLGQVFVDNKPFAQVRDMATLRQFPCSWMVNEAGDGLLVHFPWDISQVTGHTIEISVRDRIFAPRRRALSDIQVKGFIFEHCANQGPFPQAGAVSVRSGSRWLIENNIIRFANTIGLDFGSETWDYRDLYDIDESDRKSILGGRHIIKDNIVSDNGLCGIAGWDGRGTRISGNVVEHNSRLGYHPGLVADWEEQGGIKVHQFDDGVIEGNLVRDNDGYGVWMDNLWPNARISRNVILSNTGAGIFIELGGGPALIDNNLIAGTRPLTDFYAGDGIYMHDASGVTIAHNLIVQNAHFGVFMRTVSERKVGTELAETSHQKVLNNLILNNNSGALNIPFASDRAKDNQSDYNVLDGGEFWPYLFKINTNNGRVPEATIREALNAAYDKAGTPTAQRFSFESRAPIVDALPWRLLTGFDEHSVRFGTKNKLMMLNGIPAISLQQVEAAWAINAPRVPGVDRDFTGRALSGNTAIPGPFQRVAEGYNDFLLWPILPASP